MAKQEYLSWLHISDFHVGMKGAGMLWTQIKQRMIEDITNHSTKHGAIDLVIFSGDIVQAGEEAEFNLALKELTDLWKAFTVVGPPPKLFLVPGNHDLVRPSKTDPIALAVNAYNAELEIAIFEKRHDHYIQGIEKSFHNYTSFLAKLTTSGIPVISDKKGILPGDHSAIFEKSGLKVGLVGINSSWTHIFDGNMQGKLSLSHHQLFDSVEGDISQWIENNDINLIITHHPVNWLTEGSQKVFLNEISPSGWFDAHLHGHMHESLSKSESINSSPYRLSIQVASLFGLEHYGEYKKDRTHGYYFAKICLDEHKYTSWPRKAIPVSGGGWQIKKDQIAVPDDERSSNTTDITLQSKKAQKKKLESFQP